MLEIGASEMMSENSRYDDLIVLGIATQCTNSIRTKRILH